MCRGDIVPNICGEKERKRVKLCCVGVVLTAADVESWMGSFVISFCM